MLDFFCLFKEVSGAGSVQLIRIREAIKQIRNTLFCVGIKRCSKAYGPFAVYFDNLWASELLSLCTMSVLVFSRCFSGDIMEEHW